MFAENFFSDLAAAALDLVAPPRARERRVRALTAAALRAVAADKLERRYARDIEILLPYRDLSVRALVLELKYRRDSRAMALAAELLREALLAVCADMIGAPILVPVPMHENRRRDRGWNQTEALCEKILEGGRAPLEYAPKALMRVRGGVPQQRLPRAQRLAAMQGAMRADGRIVRARNCIVLDDVSTTGATLCEAERALRAAGARGVYLLALAG